MSEREYVFVDADHPAFDLAERVVMADPTDPVERAEVVHRLEERRRRLAAGWRPRTVELEEARTMTRGAFETALDRGDRFSPEAARLIASRIR